MEQSALWLEFVNRWPPVVVVLELRAILIDNRNRVNLGFFESFVCGVMLSDVDGNDLADLYVDDTADATPVWSIWTRDLAADVGRPRS